MEIIKSASKRQFPLEIHDAQPLKRFEGMWRVAAQAATIGLFVFALIAAIEYARPILLPVVSAVMLGMMLAPLSKLAAKVGVPVTISAIVLWLAVIAFFYGLIMLLSAPLLDWAGKGPELGQTIREKLVAFDRPISMVQDLRKAIFPISEDKPEAGFSFLTILQAGVVFVTPAIGQMVIFLGTLFFFMLGREQLRHVMVVIFANRDARLRMMRILNDVERNLTSYLSLVAVINLSVGVVAFVIAYVVGLPNPLVWGVLGFLFNFVPYIGALIMQVVLFVAGLVAFPTLGQAFIPPLLYLAFTTLEGHFITPAVMGKHLLLNPLTVFLALVFWTWLWGPIGALLAVPILVVSMVVISHLFPKEETTLPG